MQCMPGIVIQLDFIAEHGCYRNNQQRTQTYPSCLHPPGCIEGIKNKADIGIIEQQDNWMQKDEKHRDNRQVMMHFVYSVHIESISQESQSCRWDKLQTRHC